MGVRRVIFVIVFAKAAWLHLLWKAASLPDFYMGSLEVKS